MKNKKWKLFADEYLIDMNASRAYVAAGYSSKTPDKNAYKLLDKKEIKDYIQEQQDKSSQALKITREDLLQDLLDIKNANKREGTIHSLKAIEIINKMLGYYAAEKQDITIRGEQPLFSDDDEDEE